MFYWSANTGVSMSSSPWENVAYEFVVTLLGVPKIFIFILVWFTRYKLWFFTISVIFIYSEVLHQITKPQSIRRARSWRSFKRTELWHRNKCVRSPVELLRSLSDSYPSKRYEPPYPPSYAVNTTSIVFFQGWLWNWITHKGWYAIKTKKPNQISTLR